MSITYISVKRKMGQNVSSRYVNHSPPFLQNILLIAIRYLFQVLTLQNIVSLQNQMEPLYALALFINISGNCLWRVESHISGTITGQEFMTSGIPSRYTHLFK